jgi:transcriptional regulator GlxA family with amidase domain
MDDRVRKTLEYLDMANYRPVPIRVLAARVGLGSSRLEHLFKQEVRTSIRRHVLQRRIARAADLIASTDERISVIAYALGFADAANFNHAFKAHWGMSPRRYREANRTNR